MARGRPRSRCRRCPRATRRRRSRLRAEARRPAVRQATPETARQVADKTWDLVHDRPDDDPVKRRVVECHEALARLRRGSGRADGYRRSCAGERTAGALRSGSRRARSPTCSRPARCSAVLTLAFPHERAGEGLPLMVLAVVAVAVAVVVYCAGRADRRVAAPRGARARHADPHASRTTTRAPPRSTRSSTPGPRCTPSTSSSCAMALAHIALHRGGVRRAARGSTDPPSPVVRWLLAVGTPLVAGLLISRLLAACASSRPPTPSARARAARERGAHPADARQRARRLRRLDARRSGPCAGTRPPSGCSAGPPTRRSAQPMREPDLPEDGTAATTSAGGELLAAGTVPAMTHRGWSSCGATAATSPPRRPSPA